MEGKYAQALAELQQTSGVGNENTVLLQELGHIYAASGRRDEAQKVITELLAYARRNADGAAGALATVYATLGDRDQAFAWLERGWTTHDQIFIRLKVDPRLDPLRGDPRYTKLLATAGLAR
jgi:tetratricopeptide (TPR) repeat protein